MVVLSKRLQALADMVTPGNRVADVGCDHGFVSIYLVQNKICPKVFAMDVGEGPLLRAQEHIASYGLEPYIETRLSDGVSALSQGEADGLICAGMGGRLMQKILTEGRDKVASMKELILQPQSELAAFRAFLRSENYGIIEEKMIFEAGKYYPMMRVIPGKADADREISEQQRRIEDKFGKYLLERKDETLKQYLHFNLRVYEDILKSLCEQGERGSDAVKERREGIENKIGDIRMALSQMEGGGKNGYNNG